MKRLDFCNQAVIVDDGEFRTADMCISTAANIEGPFYIPGAPERNNFRVWDKDGDGVPVSLTGRILSGDCSSTTDGAIIEFWPANSNGDYDNDSSEKRYRGAIQVGADGAYTLETLFKWHPVSTTFTSKYGTLMETND